jgi:hypothetical protein
MKKSFVASFNQANKYMKYDLGGGGTFYEELYVGHRIEHEV